jgi:hypothetical protein
MQNDFEPCDAIKARQQRLILQALGDSGITSLEAREKFGILHCAGRVLELRKRGFNVITRKVRRYDAEGRPHSVALYLLGDNHE